MSKEVVIGGTTASVVPASKRSSRGYRLWVLVGVLAAIQVGHALFLWENSRVQRRDELLAEMTRLHDEVGANLRLLYESGRQHARNLARQPIVREFLREVQLATTESRSELESACLTYLLSFESLDRITVADSQGHELMRVERMGGGVGVLPQARLAAVGWLAAPSVRNAIDTQGVLGSPLEYEDERVEVRDADREVLYYGAAVPGSMGYVVVTVYASPLLSAVRALAPLEGSFSVLHDEVGPRALGRAVASADGADRARALEPRLAGAVAAVIDADWGHAAHGEVPGGHGWRARISETPRVDLVTVLPEASLSARVATWTRGGRAALVSLLVTLTLIGGVFALTLGLRRRAWLREESERRAEASLREAQRQRQLLEYSVDVVILADPVSLELHAENDQAGRFFGLSPNLGRPLPQRLGDLFPAGIPEAVNGVVEAARAHAGEAASTGPFPCVAGGRGEMTLDARAVVLTLPEGPTLLIALRDRTLEHRALQRLWIDERLSALGLIAAGFAHEVNNPLAGIGNYLSLLERDQLDPAVRTRYLGLVADGFGQIRDLVRDLLAYGRSGASLQWVDVRAVVERSVRLVQMSPRFEGIEVRRQGFDDPVGVRGDPGRLGQVFFNLLINAAAAIDGPGVIQLSCVRDPSELGPTGWQIHVDDSGPGLDEQTLGRLFDPFFTTTHGSGLGLFIAHGIVKEMGGELRAESRAEGGARFTLFLPHASPELAQARGEEGRA
ncbi:MAG: nitrogen regulation protein NR(II) [Planctomycetota bacterium]